MSVTGDGVNDSPAIKKADTGIAMGSGSDVAKNAADMILLDDNFTSLVNGIAEGRLIYENLKKVVSYKMCSNIPELMPFIFFIFFQIPIPLTVVLALFVDIGTDILPGLSLAYEHPELDIMKKPPRHPLRDPLVTRKLIINSYMIKGFIMTICGMMAYFYVLNDYGIKPRTTLYIAFREGHLPKNTDIYDPN